MTASPNDRSSGSNYWPRLAVVAAVVSCLFIVWTSAAYGAEYFVYYNDRQCGTGRMGALGATMFPPLLAFVPLGFWAICAKYDVGVPIARCSTYAAITASWFASIVVLFAEATR